MSHRDVFRRDLRSVYRSRIGTAVAAILALSTVVAVGLFALAEDTAALAAIGALLTVVVLLVLVFVGSPRSIAVAVLAFTVAAVGLTFVIAGVRPDEAARPEMQVAVASVGSALSLLLPLVGLLGSYAALVGERETGSVRFLLGLPNSRVDAYVGKFISRAAVVLVPLVVGLFLTAIVVALTFRNGSFPGILGLTAVSVPYALLFVGIGLSASAYADSSNRAVAVVIAAFIVLRVGWPAIQLLGVQGMEDMRPRPEWFYWVGRINPINAYVKLTTLFAEFEYGHPLISTPGAGPAASAAAVSTVATTHWFAAVVLLAWTLLAPVAGLFYFRKRDII
jgi:ABC-2 type transport system permease protein